MEAITKTLVLDNNETVVFPRLDLSDLFALADEVQAEREKVARVLGKEEKMDRYEIINMVVEIRTRKPTIQEILSTCSSPQGAFQVLMRSLTKGKVEKAKATDILSHIPIPDCLDTARMLILDLQEEKPKKEGAKENPLPVNPSTSSGSVDTSKAAETDNLGYYGKKSKSK